MNDRLTPAVRVVEKYSPLVVNIRTETVVDLKEDPEWGKYGEQLDLFLKEYFGENYSDGTIKYKSIGSGVIVSNEGIVITNAHVIQKAKNLFVVFQDATVRDGEVVALDPDDDLASSRRPAHPVHELRFAVRDIRIGEIIIAQKPSVWKTQLRSESSAAMIGLFQAPIADTSAVNCCRQMHPSTRGTAAALF
jgi:S1-C subfamily serine protease